MPEILKILAHEFKQFSKSNWWIFVVFIIGLFIIYFTNSGNIFEISSIFILHFFGDLSVMLMAYYFSVKNKKNGVIFQILQFFIFTILGIYAGLSSGKWHYLLAQIVFILPSIKGYFQEFKNKQINFLDWHLSLVLNLFILILNYFIGIFNSLSNIIQALGFFAFSLALMIINENKKYFLSLFGIFFIALGSFISVYYSFLDKNIKGIDVSYFLLPLVVLIFYLKNLKKYKN